MGKVPDLSGLSDQTLLALYANAIDGYDNRDTMAQDQAFKLVRLFLFFFSLFGVLAYAFTTPEMGLGDLDGWVGWIILFLTILVSAVGLLFMVTMTIDLESNMSCKAALRDLIQAVEKKLSKSDEGLIWGAIDGRDKFLLERRAKPFIYRSLKVRPFILAAYVLLVTWVVFSIAVTGLAVSLL